MSKKKRKTRKQLLKEPDEFITFSGKLIQFGREYNKQIIFTAVGIVIILLAVSAFKYFDKKASHEAFMLLKKIQTQYDEKSKKEGPEKAKTDLAKDFETILKKYPNQHGGKLARVFYANACFNSGEYEKAIELYMKSLEDFNDIPFFKDMIINSLGLSFVKTKELDKAKRYFEMLSTDDDSIFQGEALYNLGLIFASEGNNEKSGEMFEKLVKKNPDSLYIDIVNEKLGQ